MTSFSPLVAILNQNKLTRSNYVDWKRNLDIVLTAEEHKYVLAQPCPSFPSLDAPLEEKQRYDRGRNLMRWPSAISKHLFQMFYSIKCRM